MAGTTAQTGAYVPQPLPAASPQFDAAYNRILRRQIEMNLQDISIQLARLYELIPIARGDESVTVPATSSTTLSVGSPTVSSGNYVFVSLAENNSDITASGVISEDDIITLTVANAAGTEVTVTVIYQVLRSGVDELTTRVLT